MKGIFIFTMVVMAAVVSGCASKQVISIQGTPYEIKDDATSKKDKASQEGVMKKLDPAFYPARYMLMFETEEKLGTEAKLDTKGLDSYQKSAMAYGAAVGLESMKGFGVSGIGVANLAINLFFSGMEDAAIKQEVLKAHNTTLDGSVSVVKWYPNKGVTEALVEGYPEIKSMLVAKCGFHDAGQIKRSGDYSASISGLCNTPKSSPWIDAKNSTRFGGWNTFAGEGSLVTYTLRAQGRSMDVMRKEAADIRKGLGEGWYVMQAETLTNQATGKEEKVYLVTKDGVMKAYPLPPAPKIK